MYPPCFKVDGETIFPDSGPCDEDHFPLLENNSKILLKRPQEIGDCPKSSLLAALHYHNRSNPEAYKNWVRHLKDQVMESDGFLIGHSLRLHNSDRKAYSIAQDRLEKGWEKYTEMA